MAQTVSDTTAGQTQKAVAKKSRSFSGGGGVGGGFGSAGNTFSGGGGVGGSFGTGMMYQPGRTPDFNQAIPATIPAPSSPVNVPSTGGSSGGGAIGVSATGQAAPIVDNSAAQQQAAAPVSPFDLNDPTAADAYFRANDPAYTTEMAGYDSTLEGALADLLTRRATYDSDFTQTLKNLGWSWDGAANGDLSSIDKGSWDPNNRLGAYGSGLNNLQNDFAGRGLLDSSFFQNDRGTGALNNFMTDFSNQFGNLQGQRSQFNKQYGVNGTEETGAKSQRQTGWQQALLNAAARYNAAK